MHSAYVDLNRISYASLYFRVAEKIDQILDVDREKRIFTFRSGKLYTRLERKWTQNIETVNTIIHNL